MAERCFTPNVVTSELTSLKSFGTCKCHRRRSAHRNPMHGQEAQSRTLLVCACKSKIDCAPNKPLTVKLLIGLNLILKRNFFERTPNRFETRHCSKKRSLLDCETPNLEPIGIRSGAKRRPRCSHNMSQTMCAANICSDADY